MQHNDLTTLAKAVFADDSYATQTTGIELKDVGEHCSVCELHIGPRHLNARGAVMGGVLFTLADFAAAAAANSDAVAEGIPLTWVSLDATIHYLAPVIGCDTLVAECEAIKHGRTSALYQTVIAAGGRRVALVETTMAHI